VEREAHDEVLWQVVDAWAAQVDVDLVAPGFISSRVLKVEMSLDAVHDLVAGRGVVAELDDDAARSRSGRLA
jgi:hypothetical protein